MSEIQNVVIIWWWPAGHTAAIYTARAWLNPILYEWFMAGWMAPWWQLTTTTEVENFPWFPDGVRGTELMQQMKKQSQKWWATVLMKTIDKVDLSSRPFKLWTGNEEIETKSLIIATWAIAKRLHIPWENQFWQRWISACAVCDWWLPIFRNQRIVVVWWWDVACEEALYLANFWSEIVMLVRRNVLRASQAMQDKVMKNEKIKIMRNTEVLECFWEKNLESIKIVNNQNDEESMLECKWLFYAIWHQPNTEFLQNQLDLDESWYIVTHDWVKTSVEWVFAAGDVQDKIYRQAITSAWTWCMAALEAERYIWDM